MHHGRACGCSKMILVDCRMDARGAKMSQLINRGLRCSEKGAILNVSCISMLARKQDEASKASTLSVQSTSHMISKPVL